jgi:hypothetical protein
MKCNCYRVLLAFVLSTSFNGLQVKNSCVKFLFCQKTQLLHFVRHAQTWQNIQITRDAFLTQLLLRSNNLQSFARYSLHSILTAFQTPNLPRRKFLKVTYHKYTIPRHHPQVCSNFPGKLFVDLVIYLLGRKFLYRGTFCLASRSQGLQTITLL